MIYSKEEKQRIERLLEVFRDDLANREDYDVVFSEKAGYVRLITAPDSDALFFPMGGFDDLLEMFILDHLQDEEERTENGIQPDFCRVRQYLLPLLSRLGPDADYAIRVLELHLSIRQHSTPASPPPHLTLLPGQKHRR